MKTSITIYSMHQYFRTGRIDVPGFIEYAAEQGVEAVDLGYFWKDEEAEVEQVRGWLEANHLRLGAYIVSDDFVQKSEEDRLQQVEKVKHALEMAARLRAPVLRVFAGNGYSGVTFEEGLPSIVDSLKELVPVAEEKNVTLALENHGRLCGGVAHLQAILRAVDSSRLMLCLDLGNFVPLNQDPVEATRILANSVVHVHVKDMKQAADGSCVSVPVGEGELDVAACVKELKAAGYDGYYSLEYEAAEDAKAGIPRSLEALKQILAEGESEAQEEAQGGTLPT